MKARFPKFDFSKSRAHWARVPEFAQRLNAGSLIPAYIEPYLLKVMLKARPLIDPSKTQLLKELDIFVKQEMQHCKHHINFNKRLHEQGYEGLKPMEAEYEAGYAHFLANKSLRFNLAYCEGFECLSASSCVSFFEEYGELLEGADTESADLWRWHVSEEFEHRTVCSDVYHELCGLNPVLRYFYRVYGYAYAVIHLGRFQSKVAKFLIEQDRSTMTPEEIAASKARDKHVRQILRRNVFPMMLSVISPFYDPLKRRTPVGQKEFLESFEDRYSSQTVAA